MVGQVYFDQSVWDPELEFELQELGLEFELEGPEPDSELLDPEPDSVPLDPELELWDLELHWHFDLVHWD